MLNGRFSARARLATLLALGAVVLHQLRYLVADGQTASAALAHDGHQPVALALPVLLSLALVVTLLGLLLAARGRPLPATICRCSGRARPALAYALVLLAIFAGQELVEGALLSGHPAGIDALAGHGGLSVVPLAGMLGTVISLLARALGAAEQSIIEALERWRFAPADPPCSCAAPDPERGVGLTLALGFAQRAPPSFAASG